ncbi:MAG: YbaK/EbsC family protein [Chloroflexi bacterium]|nr:YbaK/EbsC family protein [Chloroflexota bacterium]MCI0575952.1 YbaK/EbsC family protein [Chloroflexota bacterium]MCI0648139.1 YbaK/EbsC family protein [Chloroflexota bacterium]MCI0729589.1 YbaK/EbsC family protein [Chloroflexota bacterium]
MATHENSLTADDLARFIAAQGIAAEIIHLETDTPTVEAAAEAAGVQPDQIGKSILFLADGAPMLVIANGLTRVDYKRLAHHLGLNRKRIRLANAEQVQAITGYPVGTVPPFGHKRSLPTLLEAGILAQEELYAGGGAINALLRISTAELQRVTGATVISLA